LKAIEKGNINALNNYALALKNDIYEKEKILLSEQYYLQAIDKSHIEALNNYAFTLKKGFMANKRFPFPNNIT
jgi:TPR repeat protein